MKMLCVLMIALVWIPLVSADGSLLVYLPFDDGDGTDFSGNNNNGEFMGNVIKGEGKFGAGIQLDGASYVNIPWSDAIDIADNRFSVEIWFKYSEVSEKGSLAWAYDMGSGPHAQFWIRTEPGDNRIRGLINDGSGSPSVIVVTKTPYNDDKWHHLAFVRDADKNSLTIYIDGEVEESANGEVGSLTGTQRMGIELGQRGIDGINKYTGLMDEFRFWQKALSKDEIMSNMSKEKVHILAVQPDDHLATTWGGVKIRY